MRSRVLILEDYEKLRKEGTIYGEIVGFGNTSDAFTHLPWTQKLGAPNSHEKCLKTANIEPSQIDWSVHIHPEHLKVIVEKLRLFKKSLVTTNLSSQLLNLTWVIVWELQGLMNLSPLLNQLMKATLFQHST